MFHKSRISPIRIALTLMLTLLLGGISLFAPNAAPTAHAQAAELVFSQEGPSLIQPGQNLTYTVIVKNLSNRTFTNLRFYNNLPANTTYVSGGTLNTSTVPARVEFTMPTLPANITQTVSWVAKANSNVVVGSFIVNDYVDLIEVTPPGNAGYAGSVNTKVEAPGTLVAAYRNSAGTPFDVNVHGFQFQNYGNDSIPNPNDDLAARDVFELFGPGVCQSGTTATNCVLSGPAQSWLTKAIGGTNGGHCDGMAATSLRLFNALPFRQYGSPATFQPGAASTINLNFPAQPIENYITHYFQTQSFIWDSHFVGTPVEMLQKLTTDFQKTPSVGYSLAFFITKNLTKYDDSDWSGGHAVAAIGIETVSATESRILIYDNNFPNERKYFTVNTAANTWRYVTASNPGQPEEAYEGSAVSGNLRLVPLTARDLPAGQYFPCPFCTSPAVASAQANAPDSTLISAELDFEYNGEGSILIVNDEGQKTGTDLTTDLFVNEIPGAEVLHYQGGLGKAIPPLIGIPITETDETFYTVYVHGNSVVTPTSGTLSIHGPGFSIGVNDIDLDANEVFAFRFSPDGDHISFTSNETIKAPELYIAHDPVHAGDPSIIFDVEDVELLAGEAITLDLDPLLERIYFNHTGPEAENIVIDMKHIWPDGEVKDYNETFLLPAHAISAFIDFGAWDGLLKPPTYINDVLQNPSVNHRLKLEKLSGVYSPTTQANAPAGIYRVQATFKNVTEVSLEDVYFTVGNLITGNVVLNADGSPAGVGGKISVPDAALGADGVLHSHESFTVSFDVGLASKTSSNLTVNANGMPHDWIHPNPPPSYDANNASFVFAVRASNLYYLPVMRR